MLRGLALCAALVALAGCVGSQITSGPTRKPVVRQVANHETRLGGEVQVVAYPHGDVRICVGSGMSDLLMLVPPRPPNCRDGLRAVGVRTSGFTNHGLKTRERWGTRYLVGVYRDGVFQVLSQKRQAPRTPNVPFLAKTPCPAPAGGWRPPASDIDEEVAITAYRHQHRGEVTSLARFRNGVIVLTSTRPGRTRAFVDRYWPAAVCVVRARYGTPLIHRVQNRMVKLLLGQWHGKVSAAKYGWITSAGGSGESENGQPNTGLEVLVVTPALKAILRRQPPGLVQVEATLKPVRFAPSPNADVAVTHNVPCFGTARTTGADEVKRFKAVAAVECTFPTRTYPGQGKWEVQVRKVGVNGVADAQRYWEQPDQPNLPPGQICTANLVGLFAPTFVDASGHWIVPRTPVDGCDHPLGLAPGEKRIRIGWRVVSVHRIRHVIDLPPPAAHCAARWGTEFSIAAAGDSSGGPLFPGQPNGVRVCIYRTSATHHDVGDLVRQFSLDQPHTARLFKALRGAGPRERCPVQRTFAWVIAPSGQALNVELGGCFRVARYLEWPGVGRGDPKVIRALLGSA